MLSIERVFTLHHSCMVITSHLFCRIYQRIHYFQIRHCRKFNRCIFLACAFHTDRSCCNDNITAFYAQIHSTAGSDSDKSICPTLYQFFQSDSSGRSADSGRSHADFLSVQIAGISYKFPLICNLYRIIKILGNRRTSLWISRHKNVFAYLSRCYINVKCSSVV